MKTKDFAALILLSALWGGSFIFIRIAAPAFGPILLIDVRVAMAALFLLTYAAANRGMPHLRAPWRHFLFLGIVNSVIPFVLIATAELRLPASLASILNSTTPLFGAVFAAMMIGEVFNLRKVVGLGLGFLGVVVVIGLSPVPLNVATLISIGFSLIAAAAYGLAGVYIKVKFPDDEPQTVAIVSLLFASLVLLPLVPVTLPHQPPSALAVACLVGLALFSTAAAYLLFFRLVYDVGPVPASMNSYLVPAFGTLWGYLFLRESVGLGTLAGFVLILLSVALVSGVPARVRGGGRARRA